MGHSLLLVTGNVSVGEFNGVGSNDVLGVEDGDKTAGDLCPPSLFFGSLRFRFTAESEYGLKLVNNKVTKIVE